MNLLLYPKAARFDRRNPLDPERFQYLEGCVRKEAPYQVPEFCVSDEWPLLYVSFGTLGAGDIGLMKRLISTLGRLPYRVLMNVGDYLAEYTEVPANIHLSPWFPQPSVIPQVDVVIHHGGNNSFTECLYFGKPALIIPSKVYISPLSLLTLTTLPNPNVPGFARNLPCVPSLNSINRKYGFLGNR